MTPHSPPFGHPDPYQPIQSPAAFTTIFSTLHKPMALRGRIPNIFIYTNTYKQTVIYLWWDNHSGYTFFLLNTRHNQLILILWTIIMENQDMLWRSRYHPTTMERINVLALMLIIRKFTYTLLTKNLLGPCNIFLYNLCQHVFFSLRLPSHYNPTTHTSTDLYSTPYQHRVLLPRFPLFSQARTNILHANPIIHAQVLSINGIQMLSQHLKLNCIHSNSITKFFPHYQDRNNRNPSTISARFLHTVCQALQIAPVHY